MMKPDPIQSSRGTMPGQPAAELAPERDGSTPLRVSRRDVLKFGGLLGAMAVFASCGRAPDMHARPFVTQPEYLAPGTALWYATTCHGCRAQCGMMAKVRDGRPIKLEGLPGHPISGGGMCAIGQAQVRGLYDSDRLAKPMLGADEVHWARADEYVTTRLKRLRDESKPVALITPTWHGPTAAATLQRVRAAYPNIEHVVYDVGAMSAIRAAHATTHQRRATPDYRFDRAKLIVAIEADFLGTWLNPVAFAARYAQGRIPHNGAMSRHVQIESRLSLTGGNADQRYSITPTQLRAVVKQLVMAVGQATHTAISAHGEGASEVPAWVEPLATALVEARGHALVVCGVNDPHIQALINHLNNSLGAYEPNATIDLAAHNATEADNGAVLSTADRLAAGEFAGAILIDVNPVYDHPVGSRLADALKKLDLSVAIGTHRDETAHACEVALPAPHGLERWEDGEPRPGLFTLTQPAIRPLFDPRDPVETLARWAGEATSKIDLVRATWRTRFKPRFGASVVGAEEWAFEAFWRDALQAGFVVDTPSPAVQPARYQASALPPATPGSAGNGATLMVAHASLGVGYGAHANNPWLLELPDPVTKATWTNLAVVGSALASQLGVAEGDVVRVAIDGTPDSAIELPALIGAGIAPNTVAIALGFGRSHGQFATDVGARAAGLCAVQDGHVDGHGRAVTVTKTGATALVAKTQTYDSETTPFTNETRDIARELEHGGAGHDDHATDGAHGHGHGPLPSMWPSHDYTGHKWAMSVDLARCTGCNACVIACGAENNLAIVGAEEVALRRDMQWLRIDRYIKTDGTGAGTDGEDVRLAHIPVMCQQCDNAPCESVCPVAATTHSNEGLNEQVYNRCVGTRYCANNCPYRARRFNWFEYDRSDKVANLVLNPDVTVRSRGVMEKCTFCVQRISEAKHAARRDGRDLADGDIVPACAQSCPTQAIVFGDEHDPDSLVVKAMADSRAYRLLEVVNTRPSVTYLAGVRNATAAAAARTGEHAHE